MKSLHERIKKLNWAKAKTLTSINKTSEKNKKTKNSKDRQKLEEIAKGIKEESIDLHFISKGKNSRWCKTKTNKKFA